MREGFNTYLQKADVRIAANTAKAIVRIVVNMLKVAVRVVVSQGVKKKGAKGCVL